MLSRQPASGAEQRASGKQRSPPLARPSARRNARGPAAGDPRRDRESGPAARAAPLESVEQNGIRPWSPVEVAHRRLPSHASILPPGAHGDRIRQGQPVLGSSREFLTVVLI